MPSLPESDSAAVRVPGMRSGQDLLAELGWPLDTEIILHQPRGTMKGKNGPIRTASDIFFTPLSEGTDDDKGIEFYLEDGSTRWGLLILFRVRPIDVPAVLERRYRYRGEPYDTIRFRGPLPPRSKDREAIIKAIWDVLPLIEEIETRGNRPGKAKVLAGVTLDDLRNWHRRAREGYAMDGGPKPRKTECAEAYDVSVSTLDRHLDNLNAAWSDVTAVDPNDVL